MLTIPLRRARLHAANFISNCSASVSGARFDKRQRSLTLKLVTCGLLVFVVCATSEITRAQSFSSATTYGLGANPNYAAAADLNGDGKIDLVAANVAAKSISVLINNGNGTFQNQVVYVVDFSPEPVAVGDFNNDTKPDLAVGNFNGGPLSTGSISVLLGNGDGTFNAAVGYVARNPGEISVADFNGDGKLDLAAASKGNNSASVLLGNGNGTFQATVTYPVSTEPTGISAADFTGDGKPDLAVTNYAGNSVSILLNNGDGTFQAAVNYSAGATPRGIATADLNGDGKQDLAVAVANSNVVLVYLGNGNGTFQSPGTYPVGPGPIEIGLGDFNGDGKLDAVVVNANAFSMSVLRGNGNGTFQAAITTAQRTNSFSPTVGDFDADGKPDVAILNNHFGLVDVLLNSPSMHAVPFSAAATVPATLSVASFSDYDASKTACSFTSTIDWGDASAPTPGTVVANGSGGFNVIGSHTYAAGGIYVVNVQIADDRGNFASVASTATVGPADGKLLSATTGSGQSTFINNAFTNQLQATYTESGTPVSGVMITFTAPGCGAGGTFSATGTVTESVLTDGGGIATASMFTANAIGGSYLVHATVGSGSPATSFSLTNSKLDQTITFGSLSDKTFGDADFSVSATASSGLTVTFGASGNCTVSGSTVHITAAGSCTITASQAGNASYNPAPDVPQSFTIAKANQTITFGALSNKTFGDPDFNVSATATSGLAVSFGATGQCTVSGNTVHITAAGSCTITASQAGNSNYNPAPDVPQSFNIAKANQTITFGALSNKTFGDPDFNVSATASSGLAVSFGATGNCTISTNTVHITGAGSCTVTASQAGDSNYNAAPNVPRSFTIAKANQTITFGALSNKTFGDPDFNVSATASSGLAVSFGASGNCTINASTVHITGAGSCTVTASQAGDSNYNAAPNVPRSFTIVKANQTITFGALSNKTFGDPDFTVSATASSNLAVSFGASGNCTISGSLVHITGAGSCTITASQAGDSNYNAAPNVPRSFTIAKANQTITFGALSNKTFGDPDFNVSATASSNLAVSFAASGNCTISTSTVHITGAGSCTITASQAGNTNFNAAPNVPQSFNIAKAASATAVSSSTNPSDFGQSVTFTVTVSSAAGVPGGTVQLKDNGADLGAPVALNAAGVGTRSISSLAPGTHTITAEYSGNTNFLTSTGTLSGGQVVRPQPSLSVDDVSVTEGNSGTKLLNFTVTLSAASNLNVNLTIATANGTATAPSDYVARNNSLVFTAGETSKTVSVTINGDVSFEADETFTLNLSAPVNATINRGTGTGTIQNDDAQGGFISFSQSNYTVSESAGFITVTVNRTNDVSGAATVDYGTDDTGSPSTCGTVNGLASSRCDFTKAVGTVNFAAGEVQKSFTVLINRDSNTEGQEMFTASLSNPTGGASLATPFSSVIAITDDNAGLPPNAIDDPGIFVRMHYHDFLNREPDQSGLNFWTNQITSCGNDAQCTEVRRVDVSASFFLSIEFQQSGYLVERFYKTAYGDATGTSNFPSNHQLLVPVVRFDEFLKDTQRIGKGVIVLQPGWEQLLEANKQAYALEFVQTARFTAANAFPTTMTPTEFVGKLNQNAGNVLSANELTTAINFFSGAANSSNVTARAQAVRMVADDADLFSAEYNRAFVLAEYFGYLRRNPNDAPEPTLDYTGYDFWLTKLNQFNGNYINAEMVKAFLSSIEYRQRFGP